MSTDDPKVNISPDTQTSEVRGKRDYHIVFVSDLGAADRLPKQTSVDKDSFGNVLAAARPSIAIAVANPLEGGDEWEFELRLDSLQSFEPTNLIKQVDGGRWRLGVREKLVARQTGGASDADFQQALAAGAQADPTLRWLTQTAAPTQQAAPPPAAPAGGSILDMVDASDDSTNVAREVEQLAAAAGDPNARISGSESGRLKSMLDRLDRELNAIANAVLKHPDVRRRELAWRGLKFMVDRMDFREGVRLSVVHAERDESVDRLIEQVVEPAFDGERATPSLIVFDYPCENSGADLALFDYLGQHAHSLPVPAIFPVTAGFFNVKSLRLLKNLPNFSSLTDGWEFAKWRTLREQRHARSLAPVLGRFILRPPHQPKARSDQFGCREDVSKISDLLWAHGHIAMAVSAARAFVKNGWPTRMYGADAGRIEDLVVVDNPNDPQSPWGPGDLLLPDRRLDELPAIGINQLVGVKNNDYCMLLGGVSASKPITTKEIGTQQATLEISLPYQQFSNVVSAFLCETQPDLRGRSAEDIQTKLLGELSCLMGITAEDDDEAVQVGVGENPQQPGQTIVQVRVVPPGRIVPGEIPMDFGFAL
jgi:type VI secretion system protein ImpC